MIKNTVFRTITMAILFCFILWGNASAHRVIAFASYDGRIITVEGYLSGGERVRNGKVIVKDSTGHTVATGKTDEKGIFSFDPKGKPPFSIVLKAGPGHLAKTIINIPKGQPKDISHKMVLRGSSASPSNSPSRKEPPNGSLSSEKTGCPNDAILAKLESIRLDIDELRRAQEQVRLHDILGGIGYLFGIFGLIAILRSREKKS